MLLRLQYFVHVEYYPILPKDLIGSLIHSLQYVLH